MIYLEDAIDILNGFRKHLINELNKHKDFEYAIPKNYSSVVMANEKEYKLCDNSIPTDCKANIDNCSLCFSFRIISKNSTFIVSGYIDEHNNSHYDISAMDELSSFFGDMINVSHIEHVVNKIINHKALGYYNSVEYAKSLSQVDWLKQ